MSEYIVTESIDPTLPPCPYTVDSPPPCGWHPNARPGVTSVAGLRIGDVVSSDCTCGLAVVVGLTGGDGELYYISTWRYDGAEGGGLGLNGTRSWVIRPTNIERVVQRSELTFPSVLSGSTAQPSPLHIKALPVNTETSTDDLISELVTMIDSFGCAMPTAYAGKVVKEALKKKARLINLLGMGADLRIKAELNSDDGIMLPGSVYAYLIQQIPDGIEWELNPRPVVKLKSGEKKLTKYLQSLGLNPPDLVLEAIQQALNLAKPVNKIDWLAKLGELLKPSRTIITLSANPADFLSASFGGGFSSCHRPEGEYFNGNIANCLNDFTLLGYVGTPTRKTGRMWIYVDPNSDAPAWIHQQKTYGSMTDRERKAIRLFVERLLEPDVNYDDWVKRRRNGADGCTEVGYFDTTEFDFAYRKGRELRRHISFTEAICLKCGGKTTHQEGGVCEDCVDSAYRCQHCERRIDEDDTYWADGAYCESCYADLYTTCSRCGDSISWESDDLISTYTGAYCGNYCAEHSGYRLCDDCGEWVLERNMFGTYCESCMDRHGEECAHCGLRVHQDDSYDRDGQSFCDEDCYEGWLQDQDETIEEEEVV